MGINNFLGHFSDSRPYMYHHLFYEMDLRGEVIRVDAAGALWQFDAAHAADFLRGIHIPALTEWVRFFNFLCLIYIWKLFMFMDGIDNPDKAPENAGRREGVKATQRDDNLQGQIKNTPEYMSKAVSVCRFFDVDVRVSAFEADPQVAQCSLSRSLVSIRGDLDVLAYGRITARPDGGEQPEKLGKIILVKSYTTQ